MSTPTETSVSSNAQASSPAVSGIDILNTGWGEQHKEHRFGSWMPRLMWVLLSRSWVRLPIQSFLIHHREGPVLFDAGLDPAINSNPDYIAQKIGQVLLHRIFRFHIEGQDALRYQLEAAGVAPQDVQQAVISHLHFDHVGGIADIPNAQLLVSETEWAQLSEPHPEREWILREHIQIPGANWRPVRFEPTSDPLLEPFGGCHDVRGDGALVLLPTPGHTPGSTSLLIRSEEIPPILLAGDLAYEPHLIWEDRVPGTGNADQLHETYAKVRGLRDALPNLVVLTSHDLQAQKHLAESLH
ncbi:N-acyl homoserine lactonase family protein [Hyphobacterium sp.]|uniref:N-acyl homoserine lactonase family protein n=1 Tax=Hyphobacterium sp. TaxID=2004662 RepID=UPI003BAA6383